MPPHATLPYRPDIDGLRGVAVLAVVLFHLGLGVSGGFVGVDVFFVISGYLITGLLLRDFAAGTFSIAEFWVRRIRRIAPALVLMVVATLLAGWWLLLPGAYRSLGKSAAAVGVSLSNVYFWKSTSYFAPDSEFQPLLHTWSLAVEEQFYLVLPLALMFLRWVGQLRRVLPWFLLAFVVSLLVSIYGVQYHASATFYLLPTRAWELLAGSLLAIRPLPGSSDRKSWGSILSWLGLGCVLAPCLVYDGKTPFPGLAAVPPVVGTALLIAAGGNHGTTSLVQRLLTLAPLRGVGLISYSLYLWHWPVLVFARYHTIGDPSLQVRLGLFGVSVVMATLSWRFVETPLRTGPLLRSKRRALSFAVATAAGITGLGVVINRADGIPARVPAAAIRLGAAEQVDLRYVHEHDARDVPDGLARFGDCGQAPKVIVWGDSHAMAILPAIELLAEAHHTCAVAATHSSDPPIVGFFQQARFQLDEQDRLLCKERVLEYCVSSGCESVLLVANWTQYSRNPTFDSKLLETVDMLRAGGLRVSLLNSVPLFPFNVPRTLSMSALRGSDPARFFVDTDNPLVSHQFDPALLAAVQQRGVTVLDPRPALLHGQDLHRFVPIQDGESLYRDDHHLSTSGALLLAPLFAPIFRDQAAADSIP